MNIIKSSFIVVLLFGKTQSLTPEPINIKDTITISLEEPIHALNAGASIEIDVTNYLAKNGKDRHAFFTPSRDLYKLINTSNLSVILRNEEHSYQLNKFSFSVSKSTIYANFSNYNLPAYEKFNEVIIWSSINIVNAKVFWQNYGK